MEQSVFKTVEDLQKAVDGAEELRNGSVWAAQDFKVLQQLCSKITEKSWTSKSCLKFCQDFEALTHKPRSAEAISKRLRIQHKQETADGDTPPNSKYPILGASKLWKRVIRDLRLFSKAETKRGGRYGRGYSRGPKKGQTKLKLGTKLQHSVGTPAQGSTATLTEADLKDLAALRVLVESKKIPKLGAQETLQNILKINFGDLS